MPIFEQADDDYRKVRGLYKLWHRNDFITHLMHEATGGQQLGASGDYLLGQALWQRSATNNQIQRAVEQVPLGTQRIQGVQVSNVVPTNGQVLVFNSSTNRYEPRTLPVPGSSNCILAGNQSFVNGSQPSYSLGVGGVLDIALVGAAAGVEGVIGSNNAAIEMSFAGTAKNMYLVAVVTGPANTTYTLKLFSTATGNTPITASVLVPSVATTLVTFIDTTHTYSAFQFEGLFYKLTHNAGAGVTVLLQGYSLEYDHA